MFVYGDVVMLRIGSWNWEVLTLNEPPSYASTAYVVA